MMRENNSERESSSLLCGIYVEKNDDVADWKEII
jgi:hypothetical protein